MNLLSHYCFKFAHLKKICTLLASYEPNFEIYMKSTFMWVHDAHLPYSNVTLHAKIYIQGDSFPLPFTLTMPTSRSQRLCPLSECKVMYVCLCVSSKEYVQVFLCFERGHVAAYKETVCLCVSWSAVCPCGCV